MSGRLVGKSKVSQLDTTPGYQTDLFGGFRVEVRLEILSDDKYKPSFFQLEMSIHPRY